MGAANSGSVGRGKLFSVVDHPAQTDDNAAKVQWDLRIDPNRPAQTVANARAKREIGGLYTSRPATICAHVRLVSPARMTDKKDGSCEQ
jgi:hypothetical protein